MSNGNSKILLAYFGVLGFSLFNAVGEIARRLDFDQATANFEKSVEAMAPIERIMTNRDVDSEVKIAVREVVKHYADEADTLRHHHDISHVMVKVWLCGAAASSCAVGLEYYKRKKRVQKNLG